MINFVSIGTPEPWLSGNVFCRYMYVKGIFCHKRCAIIITCKETYNIKDSWEMHICHIIKYHIQVFQNCCWGFLVHSHQNHSVFCILLLFNSPQQGVKRRRILTDLTFWKGSKEMETMHKCKLRRDKNNQSTCVTNNHFMIRTSRSAE